MPAQHWFDTFKRTAIAATSRRDVMRAVAALLPGFLLGADYIEAANKKKGKKGKKKGGKGKKPKRPDHLGPPDPDVDDCDAFLDDPGERENCKRDRERCRAPNQFCIHAIDNDGDDDIRGYSCCTGGRECCITGCKDTSSDPEYCGAGCGRPCDEDEQCVNGTCQEACPERLQGESFGSASENACEEVCPPGWKRCGLSCEPDWALCCGNQVACDPSYAECCVTPQGVHYCTYIGNC